MLPARAYAGYLWLVQLYLIRSATKKTQWRRQVLGMPRPMGRERGGGGREGWVRHWKRERVGEEVDDYISFPHAALRQSPPIQPHHLQHSDTRGAVEAVVHAPQWAACSRLRCNSISSSVDPLGLTLLLLLLQTLMLLMLRRYYHLVSGFFRFS